MDGKFRYISLTMTFDATSVTVLKLFAGSGRPSEAIEGAI